MVLTLHFNHASEKALIQIKASSNPKTQEPADLTLVTMKPESITWTKFKAN